MVEFRWRPSDRHWIFCSPRIHRQFIANSYFRGQQTENGTVNGMPNVDWISGIERDNF
jgi:hypothetical protein